ncbi:Tm-1-like ATP-binding domain-containing protein [Kutzneria viridogrisea]|uniref:Uncharacterized protein n=2 Tax=Kutzneria TaxID=43356 RepID=W5WJM3_9PSEU|nr:Tm-1-like ATP-binding domain-containing protein [Kutzneria albida]AHI00767.1 hypothetical protein KALB_7409 [Kutzneria albida DSM 43870]MBA8926042.1 uncharacterized protein (UPF0261 family) [Kutzneria viridogrisea]
MTTVVLLGTLDTKGPEYAWLVDRVRVAGCETVLVDTGVLGEPGALADVPRERVSEQLGRLRIDKDRGAAIAAMAEGAAELVVDLHRQGQLHGVLAVGGSSGSALAAHAMRALPVGVPKLLVSTMAAGDCSPYVGGSDITMMYSVVDIAGINQVSERVLGNAAAAIAGMALAYHESERYPSRHDRPLVAASMFGVTTPAVDAARGRLEELGYEVLVFHATGAGGRSLESLADGGFLAGVLDLTTTELADDLVGGVLTAGPRRLTAAARNGVPQVVSAGALDMVNFGPLDSVPARFTGRTTHVHNPSVTLVRTTGPELAELGRRIAAKLSASTGPTAFFLPKRGFSALDAPGGPFHDPAANAEFAEQLRSGLATSTVELHELDQHVNDAEFAVAAAERLHELIRESP